MKISLQHVETVTPELARLARKAKDLTPVMRRIEEEVMAPAASRGWAESGLHSRSGELQGAVTPFSGRLSAGVGLRYKAGKDLVWPKAVTHTFGRKKWSNRLRRNRKTGASFRRSPWGDIPARPFIPDERDILRSSARIGVLFRRHFDAETA